MIAVAHSCTTDADELCYDFDSDEFLSNPGSSVDTRLALVDNGESGAIDLESDNFETTFQVQDNHGAVGGPGAGEDTAVAEAADMIVLGVHQSRGKALSPGTRENAADPTIEA
ncbi:MAG: hypothetical protein CVV18_03250 [Gammaproteobacteria bacterium HGW-Gammaproteobacteria-8]|nr:MAG: hypothetical protein CVV18_03250 [Gammaproteobacteria bacterium HGW-Gammaproteobacteria-8]